MESGVLSNLLNILLRSAELESNGFSIPSHDDGIEASISPSDGRLTLFDVVTALAEVGGVLVTANADTANLSIISRRDIVACLWLRLSCVDDLGTKHLEGRASSTSNPKVLATMRFTASITPSHTRE